MSAEAVDDAVHDELKQAIWSEISKVQDPEIGLGVVDLGLIYGLELTPEKRADVKMTFTSMACPYGPQMRAEVHAAASRVEGVSDVDVEIVFSPPWNPREMASEEARMYMGIY
ncbi:MAG: metal-sulfur cluster assembly factor [Leptospirales bacterium]|nr:metal-sulfur cluster assembly factor [Leptospirales bacterium]